MKVIVVVFGLEDKIVFYMQMNKINENSFEYRFYFNYIWNILWICYLFFGFIFYFVFFYLLMVNCLFNMFGFRCKGLLKCLFYFLLWQVIDKVDVDCYV